VRHLDSWIKIDQLDVTCFFFLMLNMFRMLIHPSSTNKSQAPEYWCINIRNMLNIKKKHVTSSWSLFIQLFQGDRCLLEEKIRNSNDIKLLFLTLMSPILESALCSRLHTLNCILGRSKRCDSCRWNVWWRVGTEGNVVWRKTCWGTRPS